MSSPAVRRIKKEKGEDDGDIIDMDKVAEETKGFIEKVLGDVSKTSATKQLILGTSSGWFTGFVTMKVGKMAAVAVGGGIILLQIANQKGYIKINWDKVYKQVDKVSDKVEEHATGQGPQFMDKVERFVDRKLDKAEELLKKNQRKARRWYHSFVGDENGFQVQEVHIFMSSFIVGFAIGAITS